MNAKLDILLERIALLQYKYDRILSENETSFNIFSVLRNDGDEVYLHSAFLGELLNPKGSHKLKAKFLQAFVTMLNEIKNIDIELNYSKTFISIEHHTGEISTDYKTGGRIDLYLSDGTVKIAIENKIYAGDQKFQLLRYSNYIKSNNLFYLTLEGEDPSEQSKGDLILGENFFNIAYEYHILEWLEKCKMIAVDKPIVRETIQQYINLVKKITGNSLSKSYLMEMTKDLLKDKATFKLAHDITKGYVVAKANVLENTLKSIYAEVVKLQPAILAPYYSKNVKPCTEAEMVEHCAKYFTNSQNNRFFGISIPLGKDEKVQFRIEIDHNLFFGFVVCDENNIQKPVEDNSFQELKECMKNIDDTLKTSDYWLGWKFPTNGKNHEYNFKSFTSDEVFRLAEEEHRSEYAIEIANQAFKLIERYLKEKL